MSFDAADVALLVAPFRLALIGKFSHSRPFIAAIRSAFVMMGFSGPISVGVVDQRHILIRPSLEADYLRFRSKETWCFARAPMRVFKWTLAFNPRIETPLASVWVSLPALSHFLFAKSSLFAIAQCIGNILMFVKVTTEFIRPSRARICIEMDVSKSLPSQIRVDLPEGQSFWQPVDCEAPPAYCIHCFHQGHSRRTANPFKTPTQR